MIKINFVDDAGVSRSVDVESGAMLMEAAMRHGIPGMVAECGGACACATCHVYVDDKWLAKLPQPTSMELEMLDFAVDKRPSSRLSCQIVVDAGCDGLTVSTPERQA
jgi:2Fe-2S ferredoxin